MDNVEDDKVGEMLADVLALKDSEILGYSKRVRK
jgi:hypothetical protein